MALHSIYAAIQLIKYIQCDADHWIKTTPIYIKKYMTLAVLSSPATHICRFCLSVYQGWTGIIRPSCLDYDPETNQLLQTPFRNFHKIGSADSCWREGEIVFLVFYCVMSLFGLIVIITNANGLIIENIPNHRRERIMRSHNEEIDEVQETDF